ncbi:LYR motif-containing protein 4 isoform 2-T2 [Rhinophrynus dorsalis]
MPNRGLKPLFIEDTDLKLEKFPRTYAIRRIRDAFREKKNVDDFHEIQTLVHRAKENLSVIQRQVSIGQMYSTHKLIIESSEKK